MKDERELTEHDWNLVVQCAAKKNETFARSQGPVFYDAYRSTLKQMEENERKGIKCTYDVEYDV